MNRLLRFGAVLPLLAILGASVAPAQVSFNVAAGLAVPTGDLSDFSDAGYALIAGLGTKPIASPLAFRVEGIFTQFNVKNSSDANTRIIGGTGNAIYDFSMGPGIIFTPYATGGVGFYSTRFENRLGGSGSDTNFGWNIGGGIRTGLSGFSAYVEARYHSVGNNGGSFIPIVFGLSF